MKDLDPYGCRIVPKAILCPHSRVLWRDATDCSKLVTIVPQHVQNFECVQATQGDISLDPPPVLRSVEFDDDPPHGPGLSDIPKNERQEEPSR